MDHMAASSEKRLVLITGAGASVNFGAAHTSLPLMAGWSDALVTALDEQEAGLAATIGLRPGLRGDEFEAVIGDFLRWTQTFDVTKRFLNVGRPGPQALLPPEIEKWLLYARERTTTIIQTINNSLWREFSLTRVDTTKATETYGKLLQALYVRRDDVEPTTALFSATTNYDRSAEAAFAELRFAVDTGARGARGRTQRLDVDSIDPWADRMTVPHLHLHGAVGWYRDQDRGIRVDPGDQAYDNRLTPAVLYPDPNKDPLGEGEVGVNALWNKFTDALKSATHILVLGHSLHDRPLGNALAEHRGPHARLAFTFHHQARAIRERLKHHGLNRHDQDLSLVRMDFQPKHDFKPLRAWIDGGSVGEDGTVVGVAPKNIN
jgi:hypothetical protein